MNDFIYDLTTLITQASIKFPHSKVIYSSLLPCADIPIYTINYINQQLIAACSKLPNVFLVGHENLFAYGPDVLHDNRHVKKRHIGLFATILINAVVGKLDRRVPFVQEIHLRPFSDRHHPLWKNTRHTSTRYRKTKLDYFLSKHHQPTRDTLTVSSSKNGARTKVQWRYSKRVNFLF